MVEKFKPIPQSTKTDLCILLVLQDRVILVSLWITHTLANIIHTDGCNQK